MGMSKSIRDKLITTLSGLQLNGEPAFTQVVGTPRGEFDSEPLVRVLPGDQSAEKGAFAQDDRGVNMIVRTHLKYRDDGSEFGHMYDLTDLILDALGREDQQGDYFIPGAYIVNASRGDWFEAETPTGMVLMCDVNVEVRYTQDTA